MYRTRWWLTRAGAAVVSVLALAAVADAVHPPDISRFQARGSLLFASDHTLISALAAPDDRLRFLAQPAQVAPQYLQLLLAVEDQRFYTHPGVDPLALVRASYQYLSSGQVVSGASTITMQTVRLLHPRPRTLTSKLVEMAEALQLSLHFSKPDILTMYLTLAPYGGRIEGIEAASRIWLDKSPQTLTLADAALLVALPAAPERLRPDRFPEKALAARNRILSRARAANLITVQQASEAMSAPLPQAQIRLPDQARHLAERLNRAERGVDHVTSLDSGLTNALNKLLGRELVGNESGVTMAALVVETATGHVVAYNGSADYYSLHRHGMIDMITAIRSPGSTLKPFIYAMGFEGLLLHPATLVTDAPQRFRDYAPGNFDNRFHGDITVAEALQRSFNLPAVALLNRLGPVNFDNRLQQAGVTLAFNRRMAPAALPIALGGVGISLENLVRLYGAFGADGTVVSALSYASEAPTIARQPFVSASAAWYIRNILKDTARPAGFSDLAGQATISDLAFKTGTSYGFRDAWAMGFTSKYTIGVWVGRPDGQPCTQCVGIRSAAPILLKIVSLLPKGAAPTPLPMPPDVLNVSSASLLPPALQRFQLKGTLLPDIASSVPTGQSLGLTFPIDSSVLEVAGPDTQLPLRATGGQRPLVWFVNGTPLAVDAVSRDAQWKIESEGYAHISVKDAAGASASAEVYIAYPGHAAKLNSDDAVLETTYP